MRTKRNDEDWMFDKRLRCLEGMETQCMDLLSRLKEDSYWHGNGSHSEGAFDPHVVSQGRNLLRAIQNEMEALEVNRLRFLDEQARIRAHNEAMEKEGEDDDVDDD